MLISFLLIAQAQCSPAASEDKEPQEGVVYAYPYFEEEELSYAKSEALDAALQKKLPMKEQPQNSYKMGNTTVTLDIRDPDFLSECQHEWDQKHKKKEKKSEESRRRERSSFFDDKQKKRDDRDPGFSLSIKWGE
ncbi:MAG TPA: hypothetical protein VGJ00_03375 [Rhabdochlamydiaceae bacterium]|jgi:hypothetical protein